jgi:hypothetical protein
VTAVDLSVYTPDGATLIAAVPRRDGVQWQDENNGVGAGQFRLHLDDALLSTYPSLLDPFNIVKVKPATEASWVYAWQLEELAPTQVSSEEKAGRWVTVSGRQVLSLLETAQVMGDGDHRTFDFSAMDLPGWPADWSTPVGVAQSSDPTARGGAPVDWPDPTAQWLWSTDPTLSAPAERNWFRSDITVTVAQQVKVWASCDNSMSLRIDGEPIITTDPTDLFAWRQTYTWTGVLEVGNHVISAWVDNAAQLADNPGGFLFVMGTATSAGDLDTVIVRSDTTAWLVHPAASPPGWPAAHILGTLLTEAQTAGDLTTAVTWDFTDTLDSDGNAWTDAQDVQIPVGEDLLTTAMRWAGTVLDLNMTPDLVVQARLRRGSDVSATVEFTDGVDVMALAPSARYGPIRNVVRAQWSGGWVEAEDSTSVAVHGRRVTTLAVGDAGSAEQALAAATLALADLTDPQITLPLSATSARGPQPYAAFGLGDTITAPALLSGTGTARVMSVTGTENENRIDWTFDLYPETTAPVVSGMTDFEPVDFVAADFV